MNNFLAFRDDNHKEFMKTKNQKKILTLNIIYLNLKFLYLISLINLLKRLMNHMKKIKIMIKRAKNVLI